LTYQVRVDRYVSMHDAGRIMNPMIATGQIRGAFAQGVAAALYEEFTYNEEGAFSPALLPIIWCRRCVKFRNLKSCIMNRRRRSPRSAQGLPRAMHVDAVWHRQRHCGALGSADVRCRRRRGASTP